MMQEETGPVSANAGLFSRKLNDRTHNVIPIRANEDNNPGILLLASGCRKKGFSGQYGVRQPSGEPLEIHLVPQGIQPFHGQFRFHRIRIRRVLYGRIDGIDHQLD